MKNNTNNEQHFHEKYAHFREVDPFALGAEDATRLTSKILEQVNNPGGRTRGRMVVMYAGVSTIAAAILFLIVLNPWKSEPPLVNTEKVTAEVTVNDLHTMDEALIQQVVMESLGEGEDLLAFVEAAPEEVFPVDEDSDDDYLEYLMDNLTLDEVVELLMQGQVRDL